MASLTGCLPVLYHRLWAWLLTAHCSLHTSGWSGYCLLTPDAWVIVLGWSPHSELRPAPTPLHLPPTFLVPFLLVKTFPSPSTMPGCHLCRLLTSMCCVQYSGFGLELC